MISHFDQGQDQPAFSPDQLASGSLRGAAEDQAAAADQPGGGSNQPGTNQLRRTRGSGPTRANQAWRSGHQAPTSHGSATMVGRPPPAVQPVRILAGSLSGVCAPTSRVESRENYRKGSSQTDFSWPWFSCATSPAAVTSASTNATAGPRVVATCASRLSAREYAPQLRGHGLPRPRLDANPPGPALAWRHGGAGRRARLPVYVLSCCSACSNQHVIESACSELKFRDKLS